MNVWGGVVKKVHIYVTSFINDPLLDETYDTLGLLQRVEFDTWSRSVIGCQGVVQIEDLAGSEVLPGRPH